MPREAEAGDSVAGMSLTPACGRQDKPGPTLEQNKFARMGHPNVLSDRGVDARHAKLSINFRVYHPRLSYYAIFFCFFLHALYSASDTSPLR